MRGFFRHFRGDLFGGVTAGIVALPLALAFGVSSGLGPSAGLYGAIFIGFFAALFGGTNTQISGPTAPMTAVSMVVIAGIVAVYEGDVARALPAILTVFLLAGVMQIGLGILGLGKYIRFIPYPVVSGFMTAIGVIILFTQLLPSVGYYPKEDLELVERFKPQAEEVILEHILQEEAGEGILVLEDFEETIRRSQQTTEEDVYQEARSLAGSYASGVIGTLRVLPRALSRVVPLELTLALATIVIIYGFKRITTVVPSTLVALVSVSGVAYGLGLDYRAIEPIPQGLPVLRWEIFTSFQFDTISPYVFTAFTLAMLGAIDSLLTAVVADNMTKTKHNPDRELVGQGIGNSVAAMFGGIPGAGATIRTVVNINSGGKTRLSGMVAALMLVIVLLAMGPVASQIPAAVLAGILVTVGVGVMDYKGLKAMPAMPRDVAFGPVKLSSEVIIMLIVMVLSSVWNLVYAVGVGLVIASFTFMKKMGDLTAEHSSVESLADQDPWSDESNFPASLQQNVVIKRISGPLFFGSTSDFQSLAAQIPPTASIVIIRMGRVSYMDQSGLYALEDVLADLKKSDSVRVLLTKVQPQPRYLMERIGIIPDLVPESDIFESYDACVSALAAENPGLG
ncbi:MAG: hypothetical protein Cons2KO_24380 [Congregibacter sp.]